jgi:lysophospholipase L1-like esterase
MPIPAGISTVTLTGRYIRPDGTPLKGKVTFSTPALLTLAGADTISAGSVAVDLDADGFFSVVLIATDQPEMQPTEWAYEVAEALEVGSRTYAITLPSTSPTVNLADIAPADPSQGEYVIVPGPAGPQGPAGAQLRTGTGAPASGLGSDGDMYIDLTSGAVKIHGPKASGSWPAGVLMGGGSSLITSVNGMTGAVTLTASHVGALTQSAADARYPLLTRTARSDKGIYVPPGWGEFWRAKRDAAGTGQARIVVVGGSASQGFYASNPVTKSWPGLVRTALQAQHGDGGSGFMTSSLSATILQAGDADALAAWQGAGAIIGQTGTWTQGGSRFGPGVCYLYADETGDSLTFTVRGTTVKIYTVSGGGSRPSFTYQIDGGSAVTVADSGISASNIQVTTINGLFSGTHTVKVQWAGTASGTGQNLSVCGVSGENATGVLVHNLALAGARSETYGNPATTALNATWNGGVDFPCDLAIYTAGPNDASSNTAGDTWAANVAKWVKAVRDTGNAVGDTDIMIMLPHLGTHDTTNYKYQDFAARARGLAEAYGAALVDMWTIGRNSWRYWQTLGYWGTKTNPGPAGTDSVHLSDAGYQHVADVVLPILQA